MSGEYYRSKNPSNLHKWDDERHERGREYINSCFEAEKQHDFVNSRPQVRVRQRSVGEAGHRGPFFVDYDELSRHQGQKNEPEPSYLLQERLTQNDYHRGPDKLYSPPPPRRGEIFRPGMVRRQSSFDNYVRDPRIRPVDNEKYIYSTKYHDSCSPPIIPIPIPIRNVSPPSNYSRESYDEYEHCDSYISGDESFQRYSELARGRAHSKNRYRDNSRLSRRGSSLNGSLRSNSTSSSWSQTSENSIQSVFPKKGITKMPAKLVNIKAIIDLGYPFEEEGETIIIMKALGKDNIDDVIRLSEKYKAAEREKVERSEEKIYRYNVSPIAQPSRFHDPAVIPSPPNSVLEAVSIKAPSSSSETFSKFPAVISEAYSPIESASPLMLPRIKDERAICAEIKALEAEKEALRALRHADQLRREGQGKVVPDEKPERDGHREDITVVPHKDKNRSQNKKSQGKKKRKGPSPRKSNLIQRMLS